MSSLVWILTQAYAIILRLLQCENKNANIIWVYSHVCVRVCVRACVRVCVHVCVHVCSHPWGMVGGVQWCCAKKELFGNGKANHGNMSVHGVRTHTTAWHARFPKGIDHKKLTTMQIHPLSLSLSFSHEWYRAYPSVFNGRKQCNRRTNKTAQYQLSFSQKCFRYCFT